MWRDLCAAERRVSSQNGEDGIIEAIFDEIGTTNKFFVEFGVEAGVECNTAYLLKAGWTGLMMDGKHAVPGLVQKEFVTADNINQLLDKYSVPTSFDLLSIDIDGNDYWVWRAIERVPRVVVIEYNALIPPNLSRVIAYDPGFVWNVSDYFGASLLALANLGKQKGYELVHCDRRGVNAFFVKQEALPVGYLPKSVESLYKAYGGCASFYPDPHRKMIAP